MIVKILGILDILSAVLFWLFGLFHIIPSSVILIIAFYLLIKGIIFLISLDTASILDVIVSIILFISLSFVLPNIIVFLVAFYLIQKGIFSLL
jgi:hypothetical protein